MKIKAISLFTLSLLLFTCFNVLAFEPDKNSASFETLSCNDSFVFSQASFEKTNDFTKIELAEATTYTMDTGKPMLPVVIKTYVFPKNTKITKVECAFSGFSEQKISEKIMPAPNKIPVIDLNKNTEQESTTIFDDNVYEITQLYPSKNYDYSITCGINGLILAVRMYPISYKPSEDIIQTYEFADINIVYEKPCFASSYVEEYDMVIIAPKKFSSELRPLINHKNKFGVHTFLKTTEEIYDEYSDIGRDQPEKIKYFIKDAIETYNITYVLLVGGMKGISKEWYVPVRETNVDVGWESGTISDLYYADIYDSEGNFSSWDSNNNSIFSEWSNGYSNAHPEDIIDLVPDVALGRLACRNSKEVKTVVNKIINYETMNKYSFWYKKMIVVGGDTVPSSLNEYEGEIDTTEASNLMQDVDFNIEKLYVSDGSLNGPSNVVRAMTRGAGFVYFEGHGNPADWSTHPPNDDETWIVGLTVLHMPFIRNSKRLPIVIVGGCHNSQFNVTPVSLIEGLTGDIKQYFSIDPECPGGFWRYEWIRECWSWKLLSMDKGGAIATIGNTGLGYGYMGYYTLEGLGGWIGNRFFDAIVNQSKDTVGLAHAQAITDYVNMMVSGDNSLVNYDVTDRKTVDGWVLLGDPSLKIEI